jgi:hypothetical protein
MQGIKTGVLGLALSSFIGNAWAEDVCARALDITALQTAAVQQELMVAAFACNDFGLYNSFVITYQTDLQNSDRTLLDFFLRVKPATGAADYHTYKTKLANSYSLRSTADKQAYCGIALHAFHVALNEGKKTLTEFVLAQAAFSSASYDSCGERIDGGAMIARSASPVNEATAAPAATIAEAVPNPAPMVLPATPEIAKAPPETDRVATPERSGTVVRNSAPYTPPPPLPPARVRRYDTRNSYSRPYGDSYGYSNRYGDRDPYYRNPYDRYWYGAPPQYYYSGRR